jgi:hypothetical protein
MSTALTADDLAGHGIDMTDVLRGFDQVSLEETVAGADLASRVDRKYLVDLTTLGRALAGLTKTHRILQIDGRRTTSYRTTYFDTPEYTSCRAHVQRRRRRWKVRSRLYVEDGLCRVEVKTKSGRGLTDKVASTSHVDRYGMLAGADLEFVQSALAESHPEIDVETLAPTAEISYRRACLVDTAAGTRVTIDAQLTSHLAHGHTWMDDGYAIVETKGGAIPGDADRLLLRLGAHPRSFSKYVATTSLLHPEIADNDVRSLRGTYLHDRPTSL